MTIHVPCLVILLSKFSYSSLFFHCMMHCRHFSNHAIPFSAGFFLFKVDWYVCALGFYFSILFSPLNTFSVQTNAPKSSTHAQRRDVHSVDDDGSRGGVSSSLEIREITALFSNHFGITSDFFPLCGAVL